MAGWNGGSGSSSSYRQEIGSNVSSSSGTTIASRLSSPASAYTSRSSRLSTFSMEAVMHFDSMGIHEEHDGNSVNREKKTCPWEWDWEEGREDPMDSIRSLVQEFFSTVPSANCSINDGASSWEEELDRGAWSWRRALNKITQTICFMRPLFQDSGSVGLPSNSICDEGQGQPVADSKSLPDLYHLVMCIQEAMLKMLAFVDVVVAWDPHKTERFFSKDLVMLLPYTYHKLSSMLDMHVALYEASNKILLLFDSQTSVEAKSIENEIAILLSSYKSKLGEAMRSTMDKCKTMLMEDGDDLSSKSTSIFRYSQAHSVRNNIHRQAAVESSSRSGS